LSPVVLRFESGAQFVERVTFSATSPRSRVIAEANEVHRSRRGFPFIFFCFFLILVVGSRHMASPKWWALLW
jgi:hypothetical protein